MADFSAIDHSYFFGFCSKRFRLPLGAYDRLRYLIVGVLVNSYFCLPTRTLPART